MAITIVSTLNSASTGIQTPQLNLVLAVTGTLQPGDIIIIGALARADATVNSTGAISVGVSGAAVGVATVVQAQSIAGAPTNEFNSALLTFVVPVMGSYTLTLSTSNNVPKNMVLEAVVIRGANPVPSGSGLNFSTVVVTSIIAPAIPGSEFILDYVALSISGAPPVATPTASSPDATQQTFGSTLDTTETVTSSLTGFSRTTLAGTVTYTIVPASNRTIVTSIGFVSAVICVAKDTEVLMADGTAKNIQDIERGDLVAGDLNGTVNQVARLIDSKMSGITPVSLIKMQKDALGIDIPNSELIISSGHPILHGGKRCRAKCFKNVPGVRYHGRNKNTAAKLLPINDDNETYSLYNIQFEHDGYFVANGLVVDSIPVLSHIYPLPKDLFFDQKLYNQSEDSNKPKLVKKL